MVAQRQPVDRVIDLAVGLPVVTLIAARRSIPVIRQASRQGVRLAARRIGRGGRLRIAESGTIAGVSASASLHLGSTGDHPTKGDVSTEPTEFELAPLQALPIDDYDHLAARQVVDRLSSLSPAELLQVDTYERANRHRQTVLGRISQLQS